MANKKIFKKAAPKVRETDTVNEAGGRAYKMESKHALAQLVSTGCFNNTYYVSGDDQVDNLLKLASEVDSDFLARAALFARQKSYMKDSPAFLAAILASRGEEGIALLDRVFDRVIDNGKMLRNFAQIVRSGRTGRQSFGSAPKRLMRRWFANRTAAQVFRNSVGNDPSMADIIKMVHPKPKTTEHEALFGYMLGKTKDKFDNLPEVIKKFEAFKAKKTGEIPEVPFEMLTALELSDANWKEIAENMSWTQLRMNINTLMRHNVFNDKKMVKAVAKRLADPEEIAKSKVFPYQLMTAFMFATAAPNEIREALQDALDVALSNIPEIDGLVAVFPDHSGSMGAAVTGSRPGATTVVTCRDVAALIAAAYLRKNKGTVVVPFADDIRLIDLNPRDSVMTNARKLAELPPGGTNCSAPLKHLNKMGIAPDLCIFASDNESWIDSGRFNYGRGTATLEEWTKLHKKNNRSKMVCIDLAPNGTIQAPEQKEIMNIGGFSDRVFDITSMFFNGELDSKHWVGIIEKTEL